MGDILDIAGTAWKGCCHRAPQGGQWVCWCITCPA